MAPSIISPEPVSVTSLSSLSALYPQLSHTPGAALLQCTSLLPSSPAFPPTDTKFLNLPKFTHERKPARAVPTSAYPELFQRMLWDQRKPPYKQPDAGKPEKVMNAKKLERAIEKVFEWKYRLKIRMVVDREKDTSVWRDLLPGSLDGYESETLGIATCKRIVSMGPAVIEVTAGDWGLGYSSLKLTGASTVFVVIDPESTTTFEEAIKNSLTYQSPHEEDPQCVQFIQHIGAMPSLRFLDRHGIKYSFMQQRVGDLALFFPGVYFFGVDTGATHSIEISWAPEGWDPEVLMEGHCAGCCGGTDRCPMPQKKVVSQPGPVVSDAGADEEASTNTTSKPKLPKAGKRAPETPLRRSKRRRT